jgi:hypothetical protein
VNTPQDAIREATVLLKTIVGRKPSTKTSGDVKLIVGQIRPRADNELAISWKQMFKLKAKTRVRDIILDKEYF